VAHKCEFFFLYLFLFFFISFFFTIYGVVVAGSRGDVYFWRVGLGVVGLKRYEYFFFGSRLGVVITNLFAATAEMGVVAFFFPRRRFWESFV